MDLDCDYRYKILLVGDSGVGKSSVMGRYADNKFDELYVPTIGVDYKIRTIVLKGKVYKLQIWDLSGQDRFRSIVSSYYRGADGIFLMYDVTNNESFISLRKWLDEINNFVSDRVQVILVGNKVDCGVARVIRSEEGEEFANTCGIPLMEVSAKTDSNVLNLFDNMIIGIGERDRKSVV